MQYDEAGELVRSSRPRRSWRARRPPAGSHEISFAAASGDPPRRSHHFLSFSYANPDAHVHRERPSDTPSPSRPLFVRAANAGRVASLPETRREEIAVAARASVKRTGLASRFKVPTGSALVRQRHSICGGGRRRCGAKRAFAKLAHPVLCLPLRLRCHG
jgi:hypothetical protein